MPRMSAITALDETTWAEATWPLGTHLRADGVTFAVYAPAATRVQLEIYPEALGATASAFCRSSSFSFSWACSR